MHPPRAGGTYVEDGAHKMVLLSLYLSIVQLNRPLLPTHLLKKNQFHFLAPTQKQQLKYYYCTVCLYLVNRGYVSKS
jgi:hypothetical protein